MNKNLKTLKSLFVAQKKKTIFFSGIGGVSMHSLAIYLNGLGHTIIGSDLYENDNVKKLKSLGIKIYNKHSKKNIKNIDVLIYGGATENNEEVLKANELSVPTFSRAELLSQLLKTYSTSICVAGAHGKTTTTALIYSILKSGSKNPSLHLGGNLIESGMSYEYVNGEEIVCEACEYKNSFLEFFPKISVILNISPEHLDFFQNFDNVVKSFNKFASNSHIVICEENCKNLINKEVLTYGFKNGNFTAKNVHMLKNGTYSFNCYKNGQFYYHFKLSLIGKHNVLNALASISVADLLNIEKEKIYFALKNFKGIERRFEFLNKKNFIIHDYAHHPDEISAVINETKKFYKGKLLLIFQPHTYSRTKTLIKNFEKIFHNNNDVIIYKTYSAREKYNYMGSANYLAKISGVKYFRSEKKLKEYVKEKVSGGYGVLFLGAGDINKIAKNIVESIDNN